MRKTYQILFGFVVISIISGQEVLRKCSSIIPGPKRPYFIAGAFTCCNDIVLEHPIRPKNEHWRRCLSMKHGNYDEDVVSTMWNAYSCEIVNSGNLSDTFDYKEFSMFFMRKYPQEIQDQLLSRIVKCEIAVDANAQLKLQTFEDCFLRTEEAFCNSLAGPGSSSSSISSNEVVVVGKTEVCEPIEKLKNPNHSFPLFAQPCCKGQELPYPLFDLFMDFDRFDVATEVTTCVTNLKTKLQELNYPQDDNLDKQLSMCQVACVHEADGLKGKYNANFNDLMNFKMKSVSNDTMQQLLSTIAKYSPRFQLHGANETVPMESAETLIANLDEGNKIINYCKFQFESAAEAYRALFEHCYNSEYGSQFRQEILNSSNRNRN